MKIASSNLAWSIERDEEMLDLLVKSGIQGLELAPAKNFGELANVREKEVREYRRRVEDMGLSIVAFQAFLFGHPELQLFDARMRPRMIEFIQRVIEVAAWCGATRLVYGAPKSRDCAGREAQDCEDIALSTFHEIGAFAVNHGCIFCLEPNPEEYGCNYIYNAAQAANLVHRVRSPGFQLHLDTACMTLAGDGIPSTIKEHAPVLAHFHASEPHMGTFEKPQMDHASAAVALSEVGYDGWISIEMRPPSDPRVGVKQAIDYVLATYAD